MPSTPFDAAHQKSLRALIGKVLPDVRAQHIAEAVATGYGYRTHKTFLAAVRAVEAGRHPAPAPDFDADRLIARLHGLGENVGSRDQALRFLLGVMSDEPRSGPPTGRTLRTRFWHGNACVPGSCSPRRASGGTPARSSAMPWVPHPPA